jgi:hypothetical protein
MPFFDTAESAELYIKKAAPDSPLTGDMVMASAQMYAIDIRLMLALIELDSRFGTAGLAVSTMNPGNVGNNGVDTRNYPSWQEGTNAVAEWLSLHRIIPRVIPDVVTEQLNPIEDSVQNPTVEPSAPTTEPSTPTVEPPTPIVESPTPTVEPSTPVTEPPTPTVEPSTPIVEVPAEVPSTELSGSEPVAMLKKRTYKRKIS